MAYFRLQFNLIIAVLPVITLVFLAFMSSKAAAKNLVKVNNWAYLADTVMGGVSKGKAENGAEDLQVKFYQKQWGFIQVRTRINQSDPVENCISVILRIIFLYKEQPVSMQH